MQILKNETTKTAAIGSVADVHMEIDEEVDADDDESRMVIDTNIENPRSISTTVATQHISLDSCVNKEDCLMDMGAEETDSRLNLGRKKWEAPSDSPGAPSIAPGGLEDLDASTVPVSAMIEGCVIQPVLLQHKFDSIVVSPAVILRALSDC